MTDLSTLNGYIMNKDIPVIKIKNGEVEKILNKDLMPLYFLNHSFAEEWFKGRAIDNSRINSRLLKKALGLEIKDDLGTTLKVNGACLTDHYWFMDEHMTGLLYDINIKFSFNEYFDLSLNGDFNDFNKSPSRTPELTNTGSFEKGWKIENGKWFLYKKGTKEEIFSEIFVYKLGKFLGFDMAEYEYQAPYVRSPKFTNDLIIFEPMSSLMDDIEDYEKNFNKLLSIDKNLAIDYLKIIYLDSIVFNVDRHTKNYGFLRNNNTGEILSLAPNFDNNLSLISRSYPKDVTRSSDKLIEFFTNFLENNKKALDMFCDLNIIQISEGDLNEIIDTISIEDIDKDKVKSFILNGQEIINKKIEEQKIKNLIENNKVSLSFLYDEIKFKNYFEKCYKEQDGYSSELIKQDIEESKLTEFNKKGNNYILYKNDNKKIAINTKTNTIISGRALSNLLDNSPVE